MAAPTDISVIVPIYNEEESLPILHAEIAAALEAMGVPWEVIYVDDCSRDRSLAVMLDLRAGDSHVRIVKFRRNFGQTAAMAAGFDASRGEVVITLDGDLQNDPADIPALVAALDDGYDIAAGWRKRRHDGYFLRLLPSKIANRLIALVTGVTIHDTGCTLKAFRRKLVKNMSIYAEQHRFLPVMSAGSGAKITEVVVNHRARQFGESKYGIGRATRVLLDLLSVKLISQFSQRPLHYFGLLCLMFLGFGLFFGGVGIISIGDGASRPSGTGPLVEGTLNEWELVVVSIAMLMVVLTVFYFLLGLLAELAVKASGMHRRGTLNRILSELH
jgi:glycosyltransferase involved in cell wall biosynthesis